MDQDDEIPEPVMAPVLIRSDIPELVGQVDSRVFACVDFTWKEYIEMFNVFLNANEYIIKGTAGREFSIDSKIGDYIGSFKRKLKVHPVSIEKIKKPKTPKPVSPIPIRTPYTGKKRGPKKKRGQKKSVSPASKRRKLDLDESSTDVLIDSDDVVLEEIILSAADEGIVSPKGSNVLHNSPSPVQTSSTGTQIRSPPKIPPQIATVSAVEVVQVENERLSTPPKNEQNNKVPAVVDATRIPTVLLERHVASPQKSPKQNNVIIDPTAATLNEVNESLKEMTKSVPFNFISPQIPDRRILNRKEQRKSNLNNDIEALERLRDVSDDDEPMAKNPKPSLNHSKKRKSKLDLEKFGIEGLGQFKEDSSDDDASIIARNPRSYNPNPQPDLKAPLISFMSNKVSNKDMLKVREELMKLKETEDYFKLTSITPLSAGLLEQMLCRSLPQ